MWGGFSAQWRSSPCAGGIGGGPNPTGVGPSRCGGVVMEPIPLCGSGGGSIDRSPVFAAGVQSWRRLDLDALCEAVRELEREHPLLPTEAIIRALRRAAWPGN